MVRLNTQEQIEKTNRRMQTHLEANRVKEIIGNYPYVFVMSLYAVIINPETMSPEYRRIEVFIKGEPEQEDVLFIKQFFNSFTVYSTYSVWMYNPPTKEILFVEGWN